MKIIFLGTPDFAVPTLEALVDSKHEIAAVVTQPDRLGNRNKIIFSAVKECALNHNLKVLQYEKISRDGVAELELLKADIMITCAFGQILSDKVLKICKYGVINVHGSLLPNYRGSSPIQWAVLNGDEYTGVTIMQTAKAVDSGDIILQKSLKIDIDDTSGDLFNKLSNVGANALIETLELIEQKKAVYIPQDHTKATFCKMLTKADGEIDFNNSAKKLHDFVRGMNPWPSAFTYLHGKMFKIYELEYFDDKINSTYDMGEIAISDVNIGIVVACKDALVRLKSVQAEAGKKMYDCDYLRGHNVEKGSILGRDKGKE